MGRHGACSVDLMSAGGEEGLAFRGCTSMAAPGEAMGSCVSRARQGQGHSQGEERVVPTLGEAGSIPGPHRAMPRPRCSTAAGDLREKAWRPHI